MYKLKFDDGFYTKSSGHIVRYEIRDESRAVGRIVTGVGSSCGGYTLQNLSSSLLQDPTKLFALLENLYLDDQCANPKVYENDANYAHMVLGRVTEIFHLNGIQVESNYPRLFKDPRVTRIYTWQSGSEPGHLSTMYSFKTNYNTQQS